MVFTPLVRVILDTLRATGFQCAIVGGYPRDHYFGRTPKDADIVVYGLNDTSYDLVYQWERVMSGCNMLLDIELAESSMTEAIRVQEVFKLSGNIDVIFMKPDYDTLTKVLESFDHNICQFVLRDDNVPEFVGSNFGVLTCNEERADPITTKRRAHIQSIAKEVGWVV